MNKTFVEVELPKYPFLQAMIAGGLHYFTTMCDYGYTNKALLNMKACYEELSQRLNHLL